MNFFNKQINKYDFFLFFLIVSLAFGAIGGSLQMPRLVSLLFFPFFINILGIVRKSTHRSVVVIACFLTYCFISLLWTPNQSEGFVDLLYFIIHFILFLEIIAFSVCALSPIKTISYGWLIAVTLTLVFALWEFETGIHMPYCRNGTDAEVNLGNGLIIEKEFAAVTFVNYNTYVTFLCFAIPFILFFIANKKEESSILYYCSIIVVAVACYCILKNGSRGGLLSIITQVGLLFLMKPKNKGWFITIALVLLFIYYVFINYGDEFAYIMARVSDGNLTEGGDRYVIWKFAWERFLDTFGFGVGIGGMYESMQGVSGGIYITHNIFLEILLLYGWTFFLVFVIYLLKLLVRTLYVKAFPVKVTLYTALITFPIYGIVNSGYLTNPFIFAGLASLFVFSKNNTIYKNEQPQIMVNRKEVEKQALH